MSWNYEASRQRILDAWEKTEEIEVRDLVRDTTLDTLPLNLAYRVHGVHVFSSILNAPDLVETTVAEGERSHKRYLRFLNLVHRSTHFLLNQTDARKVDFQTDRLHFMLYKPYDDARIRIARAVAIADAHQELLKEVNPLHEELPDAVCRAGIESGTSLAVRNGTKGDRELLFLGNCVNRAAKLSSGKKSGVFLGAEARRELGPEWECSEPHETPLTREQINSLTDLAQLDLNIDSLVKAYKKELSESPLTEIEFFRPTPPLSTLNLDGLSPSRTARIDSVVVMADVDNFTRYISQRMMDDAKARDAVRVLHVIRKEIRDVLQGDFSGKKIRYIGDCLQGVVAEGVRKTDASESVLLAVRICAAMRSSFDLIKNEISDASELGIAIGLDFGPISISRLGVKFSRDRVVVGRSVSRAEECQRRCNGVETEIGQNALDVADDSIREIFKDGPKRQGLDYDLLQEELKLIKAGSDTGKTATSSVSSVIIPKAYCR